MKEIIKMEYDFLKDEAPEKTVKKIQNILKGMGLVLDEKFFFKEHNKYMDGFYSLRLSIPSLNNLGSNGKGTSSVNAMASAYAEFMERFQNFYLTRDLNFLDLFPPDIKYISEKDFVNDYKSFFADNVNYALQIKNLSNKLFFDSNIQDVPLVPFYSLKNDKLEYLPYNILMLLQSSNGMAAGNTVEEALVQGLSEICERYVQKKITKSDAFLNKIPIEEIFKYKKIKEMIEYLESLNYSIDVFDSSISLNLPAICILIKNKNTNSISYNWGVHPSFPIAIERCLTEFAQGVDLLSDENLYKKKENAFIPKWEFLFLQNENKIDILCENMMKRRYDFEDCVEVRNLFYLDEKNKPFNRNIWLDDAKYTNKQILKFLLEKISKVSDDIYIRNSSFLGFPTVYIYISGMSLDYNYFLNRFNYIKNIHDLFYLKTNISGMNLSLNEFVDAIEFRSLLDQDYYFFVKVSKYMNEFILLLFSIVMNDYHNIDKYSALILEKNEQIGKKQSVLVSIIKVYFDMKSKNEEDIEIDNFLSRTYSLEDVSRFRLLINNLTFDRIIQFINANRIDTLEEYERLKNDKKLQTLIKNFKKLISKSNVSQDTIRNCINNL